MSFQANSGIASTVGFVRSLCFEKTAFSFGVPVAPYCHCPWIEADYSKEQILISQRCPLYLKRM